MSLSSIADRERVAQYDTAIEKGTAFLRSQLRPDGSIPGATTVWGYYSQPLAFLAGGSPRDLHFAHLILDNVVERFLAADGRLLVSSYPAVGDFYPYPYLIRAASSCGRFDVARRLVQVLLNVQEPSGGFRYRMLGSTLIDPAVTPHAGLALLATGHLEEARRAGDFLVRLHKTQTDTRNQYLLVWDSATDQAIVGFDSYPDVPWGEGSTLRRSNPNNANAYWDVGFMLAFLANLSLVTGTSGYRDVAVDLYDTFVPYSGFAEHVWKTPWGCAALYSATGSERHLEASLHMADAIVGYQQADGGFFLGASSNFADADGRSWSRGFDSYAELQQDPAILTDTASQMIHYLAQVRAVAERRPVSP